MRPGSKGERRGLQPADGAKRGFLRKTAGELYQSMNLAQSDLCVDCEDLIQEGSIGLLSAAAGFDAARGIKSLTYAAPAIRNAMTNLIRVEFAQFEQKEEEQAQRIEAISHPLARSPEETYIKQEELSELYQALGMLSAREQTYLLYRFGFADDTAHPLLGTALHFHLRVRAEQSAPRNRYWTTYG